jgi:hypothetical protein
LKLLLDHNLSPRLAKALDVLFVEHQIAALRDKFSENARDVDWITALDREGGWAVLTILRSCQAEIKPSRSNKIICLPRLMRSRSSS